MSRAILCAAPLVFIAVALTLGGCDVDDSYACRNSSGDDAIAACSRVIARNPIDAVAYNNHGFSYAQEKGDYDLAIADYDQAIKLDPGYALAYNNRGFSYNHKSDHDRAIADYDQAIELKPKYALAYNNRGSAYDDKDDYDRAIVDYDQAIRLDPKYSLAYNNRGFAYYNKGDYDRAIADYDQAITLNPKDAAVYYNNRGIAYNHQGDHDRAIADYDQAVKLDPNFAKTYNNRGFAYDDKGDYDRAIADYDQAIKLNPEYALAYFHRGSAYDHKGDHDRAIADYDQAIRLNPKDATVYYNRGLANERKGDKDRAIADYDEALKLDPAFSAARSGRERAQAVRADDGKNALVEARRGFKSELIRQRGERQAPEAPPANVFKLVTYPAEPGPLSAYLTPDAGDGRKLPAIIWITGGDCNSIDDVWSPAAPDNDQTASQYRQAGLVMMFPSLRGGNNNPGDKEGFLGEVNDVLAAHTFLAKQPHVDPKRIYLGGHSTGGTLALLVAEAAPPGVFRGVFSFGPVSSPVKYGPNNAYSPFNMRNSREVELRAPGRWLQVIGTPTFVIEGTQGNVGELQLMKRTSTNKLVHFLALKGATHFSVLAPSNKVIAGKILADTAAEPTLTLSEDELDRAASGR